MLPPQGLQSCPQRDHHHQHPGVNAPAAIPDESRGRLAFLARGKVPVPCRIASAGAPVVSSPVIVPEALGQVHGRIHPVAKQAGHNQAEGLAFRHAPLRRLVPAAGFALLILSHAGNALDLRADQRADGRSGDEGREHDHHRQPPNALAQSLRRRPLPGQRLVDDKACDDHAEDGPDVKGLHHAHADGQAGQGDTEPAAGR